MVISIVLFAVFTVLAMVGAYLALASTRGRVAGLWGVVATLIFFVLLYWGMTVIWHMGEGATLP
jgi:hypothetical protein